MINITNLTKKYGKHIILDDINLTIEKNDCIGIVGDNGSGKTTLLSIIYGMTKKNKGNIDFNELNPNRDISYIPQVNPLIPELSGLDNIKIWHEGKNEEIKQSLEDGILHTLGIHEYYKKKVNKMSGGMKKRLSIAIALLNKPKLLMMDEPSAALDIKCRHTIKEYINYYIKELDGTVLLASHDENELKICNKLFLLNNGKLKQIEYDDIKLFVNGKLDLDDSI